MIPRFLTEKVTQALSDTPVVLLQGPRQSGKSTLVKTLAEREGPRPYFTLDDPTVLAAARNTPDDFLAGQPGPIIIDEVQHAPDLFRAIKLIVDRNRVPGQFLLTGSANPLLLPKLSESLAGRVEFITLWPVSQDELAGKRSTFIDDAFSGHPMQLRTTSSLERRDLIRQVVRGGYPEALARADAKRRADWFSSYVTSLLFRDIRDLANIEGLTTLPNILGLLAARAGSLVNAADVARDASVSRTTLQRYLTLLQTIFIIDVLPAWFNNRNKRIIKTPKITFGDTGLMAHLLSVDETQLANNGNLLGSLLENFVITELRKQSAWAQTRTRLFHFHTHAGQEVDVVLEGDGGQLVGIEVKSSVSVSDSDFKGLRVLAETAASQFVRGIVLYAGQQVVPFGPNLSAVPLASLFSGLRSR